MALEEKTRASGCRSDWAMTQIQSWQCVTAHSGSGKAARRGSNRQSGPIGTALEERTRQRVPLRWATTQGNLGAALARIRRAGERHGAARTGGQGLSRWRSEEWTRERAPLQWATTQNNLGAALADNRRDGRAARRGSNRRWRPIRRRSRRDAPAGTARLGHGTDKSWRCAPHARGAGKRHGAARTGGQGL